MNAAAILISVDQAAELLSVSPRRLLRLARDGAVPSVDLGDGEFRFAPEQLREWVRAKAQESKTTEVPSA
jgi:excisionase family DNA binding protein